MNCSRGDVVLVGFPNSDGVTLKKRPALVVQDEAVPTGLAQVLLALITTTPRGGPSRVAVAAASPEGQAMGLPNDSVIVADNVVTVLDKAVIRVLGACPVMSQVDQALRAILRL